MEYYESERCFRRYEDHIIQACLQHPKEVFFRIEGSTTVTHASRCRDAVTSWRKYNWQTSIDQASYASIVKDLVPLPYMGHVVITTRKAGKVMRHKWRQDADAGVMTKLEAADAMQARAFWDAEFVEALRLDGRRAKPALMSHSGMHMFDAIGSSSSMSEAQFLGLTIEDAVEEINAGRVKHHYTCELTPDNLTRVRAAIGDKLNVAYVEDEKNHQIKII